MIPYIVCYNIIYNKRVVENQKMMVMAESERHAIEIFYRYTSCMPEQRYVIGVIEVTENICIIIDKLLGNKVHVFRPEFCKEVGLKFTVPKTKEQIE